MAGDHACPQCKASTDQLIGHQVRGFYDGVAFWSCASCGHLWPRNFGEGSWRSAMAADYVEQHKAEQLVYLASGDQE